MRIYTIAFNILALLLAGCGKKTASDTTGTLYVLKGTDDAYYAAACVSTATTTTLSSCQVSVADETETGRGFYGRKSSAIFMNRDFAFFFLLRYFRPGNSMFRYFGLDGYTPTPAGKTCNGCVACPTGQVCAQICQLTCTEQKPTVPTTEVPNFSRLNSLLAQVNACGTDSDCAAFPRAIQGDCHFIPGYNKRTSSSAVQNLVSLIDRYNAQYPNGSENAVCTLEAFIGPPGPFCHFGQCKGGVK